jgi:UDP-N-acetylmuramoylalanine--D-glutamate ligase
MSVLRKMTVKKPEQAVYTLVVGLGKTGLSVVRYLRGLGETVVVVDSRDIPPGLSTLKDEYAEVECFTGDFKQALFLNAHRIIVSPGVALSEPVLIEAKKKNIEIMGDIDLFSHEVTAPVIGITGSNGKTTVTTLLALMAVQAGVKTIASGNIGTPVLDSLDENAELYVLELSSFQLETLQELSMKAAVVLNISADHLDRYNDVAAYAASKQIIYHNAETLVLNKDDPLASRVNTSAIRKIYFTLNAPAENEFGLCEAENGDQYLCFGSQRLIAVDELKIKGQHNIQNALAALALGYVSGLTLESMVTTLHEFKGLSHRTQFIAEINGVNWINDSKATNVGATVAALIGLSGKHVLIAGGVAKGADFSELQDVVAKHCRGVILFGQDAAQIESVLPNSVIVETVDSLQAAVTSAQALAQQGDNVLFAPACASFDMFDSFEHRGDSFTQLVELLAVEALES